MNLMLAFDEVRDRSVERIMATGSHIAHPWGYEDARRLAKLFFGDGEYWPYGIEPNRVTLEAFLIYCYEQGVCKRRLEPEELFAKEVQSRPNE